MVRQCQEVHVHYLCALSHLILTVSLPGMDDFCPILVFNKLNFSREARIPKQICLIPKQFHTASSESVLFNGKYVLFIVYSKLVKERRNTFITMHVVIHLCQPFNVPRRSQLRVTLLQIFWRREPSFLLSL